MRAVAHKHSLLWQEKCNAQSSFSLNENNIFVCVTDCALRTRTQMKIRIQNCFYFRFLLLTNILFYLFSFRFIPFHFRLREKGFVRKWQWFCIVISTAIIEPTTGHTVKFTGCLANGKSFTFIFFLTLSPNSLDFPFNLLEATKDLWMVWFQIWKMKCYKNRHRSRSRNIMFACTLYMSLSSLWNIII